ncbi:reverse transcriptase/maturase family protein [Virgibacillus sediminis]|uniref:Reverse transcriptase domain-containing protein n=1 Tax=Virgibacillus sediminis TaxID=202260 RepID=A0ABV7A647_9BACI
MAKESSLSRLVQNWEGARGSMRNPIVVLNSLASHAKDENYTFQRLYRNLYNINFHLEAYTKIHPKRGMGSRRIKNPGTVDGMGLKRINALIDKLKKQSYQPNPTTSIYVPKNNEKSRSPGLATLEDKLVQEMVRSILESIYERQFSDSSHAFHPNRSCHTALTQIKNTFTDTRWFIKADIKNFYENMDHHTLINVLRNKIKDEKFINLIWKFLRAGYLEEWEFRQACSGTPKGGIISPILSSIYLHELDQYIDAYTAKFNKGSIRKQKIRRHHLPSNINDGEYHNRRQCSELDKGMHEGRAGMEKLYKEQSNSDYRNMNYVRYADEFLIGINASKWEAMELEKELTAYLAEKLKLELSKERTSITHSKKNARFLWHDIRVSGNGQTIRMPGGTQKRKHSFHVKLYVPREKCIKTLIDLGALSLGKNNHWKPIHRSNLIHKEELEIIKQYNAEIKGLYSYYKFASNVGVLQSFRQTMKCSMVKTYAYKYKSTTRKIISQYSINGKFGIRYNTKDGQRIAYFNGWGTERSKGYD